MDILVVEDEIGLAEALSQILREEGHRVEVVNDGLEGYAYAQNSMFDVIILDVMLPGMDGYEIARALRKKQITTPIIMLSARSELGDKIQGLDCGADDYMTKPFQAEELLARIRAVTRRQGEVILDELSYSDLALNLNSRELSCKGKHINLSQKEYDVMRYLLLNSGQVLSKETMISKIWGIESSADDNNVEAYISFLRKKLDYLDSSVSISTIRKVGYRLISTPPSLPEA